MTYCVPTETQVCCFLPKNAKPVGIAPRLSGKRSVCGRNGLNSAVNGVAEHGEWPWQAAILERQESLYVCGASLIDERWLLTAAHCVYHYRDEGELKVRVGELNVSSSEEAHPYEEFNVDRVIVHPSFVNTTLLNDIALLRLEKRAQRRSHIDIVCLPSSSEKQVDFQAQDPHRQCVVTGWGRPSESSNHSVSLKEITLPLWENTSCQKTLQTQLGPTFSLPSTTICAGVEGFDACEGDGGGPLVCQQNGRWEQVGIVSYGIGCARANLPGVYTRVLAYSTWIKQTVRINV